MNFRFRSYGGADSFVWPDLDIVIPDNKLKFTEQVPEPALLR